MLCNTQWLHQHTQLLAADCCMQTPTAFSPSSMHDYMRVVWHGCQPSPARAVSCNLPIQHCIKLAKKCCFGVLQAARLGAPDCNFCESEALTYSTFAECYAAEAEFVPQVSTDTLTALQHQKHGRGAGSHVSKQTAVLGACTVTSCHSARKKRT